MLFIFFSGADIIIGQMIRPLTYINGIPHIDHFLFTAYQSNITLLFWVPQHAIVAWVCTGLLLNDFFEDINKSYCFILCLSLLWSPFVFLGICPFLAILILTKKKKLLSFQNIVIAPIIILIIAGFYLSNSGNTSVSGFIWQFINIIDKYYLLLVFFLCEFMVHIVLMKDYINRLDKNSKSIIYTAIIFLSFLPIYVIGEYNDLAMRASIPSLFIIMIFIGRYINESKHKDYRYYIIIFLLFMGSFTGILEISRAVIGVYEKQTTCDYWYSLVNIEKKFTSQYIDEDVEENFYYSYLLKKNRPEGDIVYNLDDLIWNMWNEDSSKIEYDLEKLTIKSEEPVDTSFTCQIKLSEGVYLVYINVSGYINKIDQSGAHLSFHGVTKIIDIQPGKYNNAELKKIVKIDEDGYDGMIDFGIGGWGKSSGNIQLNDIIIMKLD
ncbi:hypothetical protein [Acetoanaerobium noterae]|uniref:hypothetical protein n=1 Tax=Acetoanaerobium noterae TaxID=745369 RepID=UPI0028ACB9E8|nr:hypothetical protein [Acetoanaerobium noterae]